MPHTNTSSKQATNRTSCHATHTDTSHKQTTNRTPYQFLMLVPANHGQQVLLLAMPHKSRKSCHASHRCEQSEVLARIRLFPPGDVAFSGFGGIFQPSK